MKFRLTYEGPLFASQPSHESSRLPKDFRLASHKQMLRKAFHKQLKMIWDINPILSNLRYCIDCGLNNSPIHHPGVSSFGGHRLVSVRDYLQTQHRKHGYEFVPLACKEFKLLCALNILFLRQDAPGSVFNGAGDIDNRIKTVIDALKIPTTLNQLGEYTRPDDDETPFFCLLEDDSQVSSFSVETDTLLTPGASDDALGRDVKLIIEADLQPYYPTFFNLAFV